jgi:hypothetical protein
MRLRRDENVYLHNSGHGWVAEVKIYERDDDYDRYSTWLKLGTFGDMAAAEAAIVASRTKTS